MAQKKILILGTKWWGKWSEQLSTALVSLGHECLHVNIHELFSPVFFHHWRSPDNFLKLDIRKKTRAIIEKIKQYEPDILISVNVDVCSQDVLTLCSKFHIKTFIWLGDSPYSYNNIDQFKLYDRVAIWDDYYVQTLNLLADVKSVYLPTAGDETVFQPLNLNKDIDLLFIGNAFVGNAPLRAKLLDKILAEFEGQKLTIKIYGDENWTRLAERYPRLKKHIIQQIVTPEEANQLYNRSKIVLNIHHPQNVHATSARTYEIALAGAFQLVEYKADIPRLFQNSDIQTFRSSAEMIEKIGFYLRNDSLRDKIAHQVNISATERHTMMKRGQEILALLKEPE